MQNMQKEKALSPRAEKTCPAPFPHPSLSYVLEKSLLASSSNI